FRTIGALRGRDAIRACCYLAATLALATATSGLAWLGTQHPTANFLGNADFEPDWECSITGRTSSRVCLRNPSPMTRPLEDDQRRQALPGRRLSPVRMNAMSDLGLASRVPSVRRCATIQQMKEAPSAIRCWSQATASCCRQGDDGES